MRTLAALAVILTAAACSGRAAQTRPSVASADAKKAASAALIDCLLARASELDDGYSDPYAIGVAVDGACMSQKMTYANLYGREIHNTYQLNQYLQDWRHDNSMAIRAVMEIRNGTITVPQR